MRLPCIPCNPVQVVAPHLPYAFSEPGLEKCTLQSWRWVQPLNMVENSTSPFQAHFSPVFGDEAVQRGLFFLEQGSIRALLRVSSPISPRHETAPHLASVALKREPSAMSRRALRTPSIVGSFFPLPSQESVAGSVVPDACHLVLAAARVPLGVLDEDVQSDNKRATTPDEPTSVGTAVLWPRCGEPARLFHGGPSD